MKIELIYDACCPNVGAARAALVRGLATAGVTARWIEWDRAAPGTPEHARACASPTILIDGADVAASGDAVRGDACRVYRDRDGRLQGVPSDEVIAAALHAARAASRARLGAWMPGAATAPAFGAVIVPKIACPLCIPVVGSVLGASGVESFEASPWSLGLAVGLVVLALGLLARRARGTGHWMPWAIAAGAGVAMLSGRFALDSWWITGVGAITFLVAAVYPGRAPRSGAACPACRAPAGARNACATRLDEETSWRA